MNNPIYFLITFHYTVNVELFLTIILRIVIFKVSVSMVLMGALVADILKLLLQSRIQEKERKYTVF